MRLLILLSLCFISLFVSAQRIVTGKVVDEFELLPMPGVRILSRDTLELGTTDLNGDFKVELPQETHALLVSSVGMEWASIKVPANCNRLEIIMLADVIYDFVTVRSINRRRYKRFKSLIVKHKKAFAKGFFTSTSPCSTYTFENTK
ncbi:carboxypeptidase-like regulatory domain-containing protein [Dyadobacter sp. NIV53]|uniref:carboxypeptidase-like regulatory domain-containing protein n=1 Tax=Dyadobacter sp. NIV53 TaxID=2861765 RepID=UPI0038D3F387